MFGPEFSNFPFCWLFPVLMIALCLFMIKGRRGSIMCGFGHRATNSKQINTSDTAMNIIEKRYALGEINKGEFEEKKETLSQHN